MLPDSIGALSGDAKILYDERLNQLREHLGGMKKIVDDLSSKGVLSRTLGAKADKEKIDSLREALARTKQVDLKFPPPGVGAFSILMTDGVVPFLILRYQKAFFFGSQVMAMATMAVQAFSAV